MDLPTPPREKASGRLSNDAPPASRIVDAFRRFQRTITFRITAHYAVIFSVCISAAFLFIDHGLWVVLSRSDRGFLHAQLKELTLEYRKDFDDLRHDAESKHSAVSAVRIARPDNHTLHYYGLNHTCLAALEKQSLSASNPWAHIIAGNGDKLDVIKGDLFDGNVIQVARSDRPRRQVMRHFERVSALAIVPLLALAIAGGALLASRTLRPIRELNAAVGQINLTGLVDARLPKGRTAGELQDLVGAFNEMLERIDSLIQSLKGTLDNVAHDLRTPLSRLRGIAELALQNDAEPVAMREALADCVEESERVAMLLNTIMDISEAEAGAMKLHLEPVSLAELGAEIAELYQHVAEEKGVSLTAESKGDHLVRADANRLRQAIANLVDNAVKYTPAGGAVRVIAAKRRRVSTLIVQDTGIGIPPEEHSRVWERLYRTDASRSERGIGLGLSLVRAIMQAHQGQAELSSAPGGGSIFTLSFPRTNPAAER